MNTFLFSSVFIFSNILFRKKKAVLKIVLMKNNLLDVVTCLASGHLFGKTIPCKLNVSGESFRIGSPSGTLSFNL